MNSELETEILELQKMLSQAYWPNRGNDSADVERGNAAVDALSVGQLALYFKHTTSGPTYVMVRRRAATYPFKFVVSEKMEEFDRYVDSTLAKFKTEVAQAQARMIDAIHQFR